MSTSCPGLWYNWKLQKSLKRSSAWDCLLVLFEVWSAATDPFRRGTWLRARRLHVTFGWRRDVNALSCFGHMPRCMSTNGSRGHIKCLNKWLMMTVSWCGSDQLDGGQRKPSHEPPSTRKHTITACEWNLWFIYTCRRSCESEIRFFVHTMLIKPPTTR